MNYSLGVSLTWSHCLVEEIHLDCLKAQERRRYFHYSWLLILISLVTWEELVNMDFIKQLPGCCLAMKYTSLWHLKDPKHQSLNNVCFVPYNMNIDYDISKTP